MRNASDLVDFTRYLISERTARYFRNGPLVNCLSAAQNRIAALLRMESAGFFEDSVDYDMVVDQTEYDLPAFFKAPLKLERVDGNFADYPKEIPHRRNMAPGGRSSDATWDIKAGKLEIHPPPTSATPDYRLWYSYSLPDMVYGLCPQASSSASVYLATTNETNDDYRAALAIDDYYNGLTFEITAGTGIGQSMLASDYTGSTRLLTVSAAPSVPLDDTSYYASHIQVPEDFWEPLCLLAANLSRVRDKDGNYVYGREFVESLKYLLSDARLRLSGLGEVRLYSADGVA